MSSDSLATADRDACSEVREASDEESDEERRKKRKRERKAAMTVLAPVST
jgi:hypothetical protein